MRSGRKNTSAAVSAKKRDAKAHGLIREARPKKPVNRDEVAALRHELAEGHQREAATAEVLKTISRSSFDLQAVLDTLIESAAKLCEAEAAAIARQFASVYKPVAMYGQAGDDKAFSARTTIRPTRGSALGRAVIDCRAAHIADVLADPEYDSWENQRSLGFRTILAVPLLRERIPIGVIILIRKTVRPFTEKQIELVTTFADQAVIAIENARLLNELQQRTDDLTVALEHQTATSEILSSISGSITDTKPVFEAIVRNLRRLFGTRFAMVQLLHDGMTHLAAAGDRAEFETLTPQFPRPLDQNAGGGDIAMLSKQVVQFAPVLTDSTAPTTTRRLAQELGFNSVIFAPMIREDKVIGAVGTARPSSERFDDRQVALIKTFADQAVIAIENARLFDEVQTRTRDLSESLEQQTATSEVLQVISSSPGDLQPVFEAMLEKATRICGAKFGNMLLYENGAFRRVAIHGAPPEWATEQIGAIFRLSPNSPTNRIFTTKRPVLIADMAAEQTYFDRNPGVVALVEGAGARTVLNVPMLKDDQVVGVIAIYRQEVRPFSEKQIELVGNFAKQAVIAIENARLLRELRQRTADLTESLEQQTATSEVLQVISSSPGELEPVFQAILENATRLCEATFGSMLLYDGETFRRVAIHNAPVAFAKFSETSPMVQVHGNPTLTRLVATKQAIHVADLAVEGPNEPIARYAGARTLLTVPLVKESGIVGALGIYRQEVRPFTDKQIDLVQSFAKQAVIAVENTRLLNELRESLQQQTATSEVLQVISSSPGELEPVFETMLANATRICEARFGGMFLAEGDHFRAVAVHGDPTYVQFWRQNPLQVADHPSVPLARLARTKRIIHIPDLAVDEAYLSRSPRVVALVDSGGARSLLLVPMLKENQLVGALGIYRLEMRPFTEQQIDLIRNFSAQAVIAIENARLLNDLRESLQQQTATADVLKVISRSTFDLKSVLQTLVESAARLCNADHSTITRHEGTQFFRAAVYGYSPEFLEYIGASPVQPERGTVQGRALLEGKVIHIPDVLADPDYKWVEAQKLGGFRTILGVPMLREGVPAGILTLSRSEVRPFADKQIELALTFADQAAIAIENVRLFDEIQDKSRQLEIASQHKSQFLANMSHELRTPLNAILGYTELILDNIYGETPDKMREVLERLQANGKHLLGLINDVLDLSKIEAGQLTLDLADYSLGDVVHTVVTAVESLAAGKKLSLTTVVGLNLPVGHGDERRLAQVLLNLVGNAIKFTDKGEVAINATAENGSFTVAVRDTGPGISPSDQGKIFEEFQQADNSATKRKGGTGLGLSIARRIIGMHGGRIWVESDVGKGSTFAFTIPVKVERQVVEP
jgi:GAF domain-containing protein